MAIHVGLIGAGNISDTHARAAAAIPEVVVSAVYAPTREHAHALAGAHGAVACESLEQLLAHRPLDLVVIGSPSGLHAEHGIAAAARKLHVLVEKPIDITAARADALIAAADRAGVRLGVIFQDRLKPDIERARALVAGGGLGRPILATAEVKWYRPPEYYASSRWRGTEALDGGGALINQGIHTVDLLLWLFGPVRRVFGRRAALLHAIEVEDTAVAVLEFENGALGTLDAATSAYPGYSRRIELTGSRGTVIIDGDRLVRADLIDPLDSNPPNPPSPAGARTGFDAAGPRDPRDLHDPCDLHDPREPGPSSASASSPVVADASAHRRVIEDFIRAIATGSPPACDGREGRSSVALIEAVYQSARTGQPVEPS